MIIRSTTEAARIAADVGRAARFGAVAALALLTASLGVQECSAETLAEYAKDNTPTLFRATKGAIMPNSIDQTNNLGEGDKALLLSGLGLTDLAGISRLTVVDNGSSVPIKSVENLHVFLNKNRIAAIPDEIGDLDNVLFLYLNDNALESLPRALTEMDNLVGMYFTANRFTEVPPLVFGMTRLKKLQFSHNRISELPPEIGNLVELRHFNMAGNRIGKLPESIAKLTKLRVCDFSDNRIDSLPEAFGQVRIVNQLRVRNNPIRSLPLGFAAMRATIDVTGTAIDVQALPDELRAKINTEKPPGSKVEADIIVRPPPKSQ